MCSIFVRKKSECFKNPEEYGHSLAANISPDHIAFSASTIFNRLAISSGCPGRILPNETKYVEAFIHILKDAGVTESCRALHNIQEADCNICFREAAKNGTLPAEAYYFSDKYSRELEVKLNSEVCEFEELTLFSAERCDPYYRICPLLIPRPMCSDLKPQRNYFMCPKSTLR
jgi:hypothetical protein